MDGEIQLISDGDGLAVIGSARDVELFLISEGLPSRELGLKRLKSIVETGAVAAQTGSQIAADSGRWVKLTEESARAIKKHGLRESSKTGLSTGVVKGPKGKGQIGGFVEFAKDPRTLLTNPSVLAGAAGIMAQAAMQQSMDEITDYLAAAQVYNAGTGAAVGSQFTINVRDHAYMSFKPFPDGSAAYPAAGSTSTSIVIARVMPMS